MTYFLVVYFLPWLVLFGLGFTSVWLVISGVAAAIRFPNKKELVILGVILVITGWFRFTVVPNIHRIYFDEDRYLTYAASFAKTGKMLGINYGSGREIIGVPDPASRITVPVINALILMLFGNTEHYMFSVAKAVSLVQIVVFFAGAFVFLERKNWWGLIAAGIFALIPFNNYWSTSMGLDSYFVFFCLLAWIAAIAAGNKPNIFNTSAFVAAVALLLLVRLESVVFLPVVVLTFLSMEGGRQMWRTKAMVIGILTGLLLFRLWLSWSVFGQTWCCGDATPLEAFGVEYLARNVVPNLMFLFNRVEFPAVISVLGLVGFVVKGSKKMLILLLWFAAYFGVYSTYFAGLFFTFEYSGSYGRFFLVMIPPLVIAAVWALSRLEHNRKMLLAAGLAGLIGLIPATTKLTSLMEKAPSDAYVDDGPKRVHKFVEEVMIARTPADAIMIQALTGLTYMYDKTAVYFGSFLYDEEIRGKTIELMKQGRRAFMFQSYTCETFPDKCSQVLSLFDFKTPTDIEATGAGGLEMVEVVLK